MTVYTFDENIVSDLHKDARGFRPCEYFWEEWTQSPDDVKQSIWDSLIVELEEEIERVRQMEEAAIKDFESAINLNVSLGAGDRKTALRWMTQNEPFYHKQDVEHWVWNLGILFTDEGRALVKELMEIVKFEEWD